MRMLIVVILAISLAGVAQAARKFEAQTIDDKVQIGYGVAVADVNGDGKPDILLADKKQFLWFRNPTWEKFVIAENLAPRDNVTLAAKMIDGKCELAVATDFDPGDHVKPAQIDYMIPPADPTQKWEPVRLPAEPTVHRMRWMKLADGSIGLVVAPLHYPPGASGSKVQLYRMPKSPHDPWPTELIEDHMDFTHNFQILNSSQILLAGQQGLRLLTRASDGKWSGKWAVSPKEYPQFKGASEVYTGKLKSATFIATVEPFHGNQLVVYVMPSGSTQPAKRIVLTAEMREAHALQCGDLLGTGEDQIVIGWRGNRGGVRMWSAKNSDGSKWEESVIDDGGMACENLRLADLDGDGRLDIIASGRATHNLRIYWNRSEKKP